MADFDDPDRVWPTGLPLKESIELHKYLIDGARLFFLSSVVSHALVAAFTPWLG